MSISRYNICCDIDVCLCFCNIDEHHDESFIKRLARLTLVIVCIRLYLMYVKSIIRNVIKLLKFKVIS